MKKYMRAILISSVISTIGIVTVNIPHSYSQEQLPLRSPASSNLGMPYSIIPLQFETQLMIPNPFADRRVRIAMLVPLTGSKASLGQSLLDSATLALYDMNRQDISIFPYDTKENDEDAKAAFLKAKADGMHIVIGPVFNTATKAIASEAIKSKITVLSFTNDKDAAAPGVFTLGVDPRQQINRITHYAIDRGFTKFALFVTGDAFGNMVVDEVQQEAKSRNAEVIYTELYMNKPALLSSSLKRLTDAISKEEKLALLIPAGGETLNKIATYLQSNLPNKDKIQILGSSQWDSAKPIIHSALQGAWFPAQDPTPVDPFYRRFKSVYGHEPARLSTIAYDAIPLAFSAAKRSDGQDLLINDQGFIGIDGILRFNQNGTSERGLAVLEASSSGNKVIDKAPNHFKE